MKSIGSPVAGIYAAHASTNRGRGHAGAAFGVPQVGKIVRIGLMRAREVVVFSAVGGGAMERLAHRLRERGDQARVFSGIQPERWRRLMHAGWTGRTRARFISFFGYPAQALASIESGQILVPTTNPFFLPVLLLLFRWFHGRPVIALIYDLYPDALEAVGLRVRFFTPLAESLNRLLFRHADGVVFIGDRMRAHAERRYGRPRRSVTLPTGADTSEFAKIAQEVKSEFDGWKRERVLLSYVGNLGRVHDWETLAEGCARGLGNEACLVVAASGPGVERLRGSWRELGTDRILFKEPLDEERWRNLLSKTDIALVSLRDGAQHTSIPSKAFSAMAAGCAILAVAPEKSDLADLVRRHDCGRLVAPGDVDGFVRSLAELVEDRAELKRCQANSLRAASEYYDLARLAEDWVAFLSLVEKGTTQRAPGRAARRLNRLRDLLAIGLGSVLALPLAAVAAFVTYLSVGSPVFFRQLRSGLNGEPFELVKFRTMRPPRLDEEAIASDQDRLTRAGQFLRATSLDELPTLWNVLNGDMTLVGPRPLLVDYLSRYTGEQARRHDVKPGITGLAQINGRNTIDWEEKLALDVEYVDERSLLLDFKILWRTVRVVLRREGVSHSGHATMPEFMGSEDAPRSAPKDQS
jgi:lipopolysaccharide/colanic/teichoic acid biosynthesis glycosyltransferase/glycosyltransferase involved in cell wall biosynthesis